MRNKTNIYIYAKEVLGQLISLLTIPKKEEKYLLTNPLCVGGVW